MNGFSERHCGNELRDGALFGGGRRGVRASGIGCSDGPPDCQAPVQSSLTVPSVR